MVWIEIHSFGFGNVCWILIQEWKIQDDFCASYIDNDATAFIKGSM